MSSLHGVARVTTVQRSNASDPGSPVDLWEQFLEFYTTSQSPHEEPPRKKRRVLPRTAEKVDGCTAADSALDSVCLARICLDLHFPANNVFRESHWATFTDTPIPISFEGLDFLPNDEFLLRIVGPDQTQIVLAAAAHTDVCPDLFESLDRLIIFTKEQRLEKALDNGDIAYVQHVIRPPTDDRQCFQLDAQIRWKVGLSSVETYGYRSPKFQGSLDLLDAYLPSAESDVHTGWELQDFYKNVHVPDPKQTVSPMIQSDLLETQLYPFQARAVDWLLRREGVAYKNKQLCRIGTPEANSGIVPSFQGVRDAEGDVCFVSHVRGVVVKAIPQLPEARDGLYGGILAEEMGLGKTVELIALMCLHKREERHGCKGFDSNVGNEVNYSKGTLIITPPAILQQWKTEIARHAPHLKVLHYEGIALDKASKKKREASSLQNLLQYDVVLTTYRVLAGEIYFAATPPDRSLRRAKVHKPKRSPLVEISWWRVCLDEAQMVESGVSNAAIVARLVPRRNAWAVSGTPLKRDIQDLRGLLVFLRYEPFASSKRIWDRINKPTFKQIFGQIAMRHTKEKVRHELRLPPQKRVVITTPFTAIEEQNYADIIKQMCEDCGVNPDGSPSSSAFRPDNPALVEKMREWLVRLRQTCLHPQVGHKNRRALGRRNGPLRTVAEVLEVMIAQNDNIVRQEEKAHILAMVQHGHIVGNVKADERRAEKALKIYQDALVDAARFVEECRLELRIAKDRLDAAKDQVRGQSPEPTDSENSDGENETTEKSGLSATRKGVRSALEVQHICLFFIATAYYQMKVNENITKPESEDFHRLEELEMEYYDKAKAVRREILQETHTRAERRMRKLRTQFERGQLTRVQEIEQLEDYGGIENREILDEMDALGDILNQQRHQLNEWREKVVKILLMPLVDEDEGKETTGEEYENSTKAQDELYVYIAALRAIVADRNLAVTGQANMLIDHEMKAAVRAATEGEGHAPELLLQVMATRDKLKPTAADGSLRAAVTKVRSLATNLEIQAESGNQRAKFELAIVEEQLKEIQRIANTEGKAINNLEKELELFRTTMNLRLEFYRQLQQISDTVAPYKEELDEELDEVALNSTIKKEQDTAAAISKAKSKQRFLLTLRNESNNEAERTCVICQSTFEVGVLTVCGHQYCKDCIRLWWNAHRNCPLCKRYLSLADFHQITYKPRELLVQEENHSTDPPSASSLPKNKSSPSDGNRSIYTSLSSNIMSEIQSIDLNGSYGTKIDTISRHLLWLRAHDPGSKSIIFTQYSEFLGVLADAFTQFRIGFTSIGAKDGIEKFRNDPSKEVFLLDAKSDSSGLNLVNATHVFLCEPLINAALELQAIARVHRIGQQRPTTVYMYLISDTVEERIYEISVARRLAHMERKNVNSSSPSQDQSASATPPLQESALEAADSLEMQQAPLSKLLVKRKGGGELVPRKDLWDCLFGGKQRDRLNGAREHALHDDTTLLGREVGRELRAQAVELRMDGSAPL